MNEIIPPQSISQGPHKTLVRLNDSKLSRSASNGGMPPSQDKIFVRIPFVTLAQAVATAKRASNLPQHDADLAPMDPATQIGEWTICKNDAALKQAFLACGVTNFGKLCARKEVAAAGISSAHLSAFVDETFQEKTPALANTAKVMRLTLRKIAERGMRLQR